MIDETPTSPELATLMSRVERCYKRSRRAAKRLASAQLEVEDADAAGRAACEAVMEWRAKNPEPQMEMPL